LFFKSTAFVDFNSLTLALRANLWLLLPLIVAPCPDCLANIIQRFLKTALPSGFVLTDQMVIVTSELEPDSHLGDNAHH